MILMAINGSKPKTKPEPLTKTQTWSSKIEIISDNGQPRKTILTSILFTAPRHTKRGKPRWIAIGGPKTPTVKLLDLEKMEAYATGTIPLHMATEKEYWIGKPLLRKEYRPMMKFGGLYQLSDEEIDRLTAMMGGRWASGIPSITDDEKILCVKALGEFRIYELPSRELIDIVTYEQIREAIIKARPSREIARQAITSSFTAKIDSEKHNTLWVTMAKRGGYAVFLMDWETREVISPIKNPFQIAWENGLDEVYPLHLIDKNRIMDPEYRRGMLNGVVVDTVSGTGRTIIKIHDTWPNMPRDPVEREKNMLPPDNNFGATMMLILDRDLNLEKAVRWLEWDGQEWEIGISFGHYMFRRDILIVGGIPIRSAEEYLRRGKNRKKWLTSSIHYLEKPQKLDFVRIDENYRIANAIRMIDVKLRFVDEFQVDIDKYDVLSVEATANLGGTEIIHEIKLDPWYDYKYSFELSQEAYLVKTDWKLKRMEIMQKFVPAMKYDPETPEHPLDMLMEWILWV